MAAVIYKVSVLEIDGVELDYNQELLLKAENVHIDDPAAIGYDPSEDTVRLALQAARLSGDAAIFPIVLQHNGNVANGTVFGYSSLIPGDDTPIPVPVDSNFTGFTFSNKKSGADFTLEFRKNSLGNSPFYTVSKVNTLFFAEEIVTPEAFSQGDIIYVTYVDNGTNASDVGVYLVFKAVG